MQLALVEGSKTVNSRRTFANDCNDLGYYLHNEIMSLKRDNYRQDGLSQHI